MSFAHPGFLARADFASDANTIRPSRRLDSRPGVGAGPHATADQPGSILLGSQVTCTFRAWLVHRSYARGQAFRGVVAHARDAAHRQVRGRNPCRRVRRAPCHRAVCPRLSSQGGALAPWCNKIFCGWARLQRGSRRAAQSIRSSQTNPSESVKAPASLQIRSPCDPVRSGETPAVLASAPSLLSVSLTGPVSNSTYLLP